jgi:hypothetical protein
MLIPRPIVKSIIADGVFMLCGNTRLMELIDYKCVISSSTIGACTTMVDAWGASI